MTDSPQQMALPPVDLDALYTERAHLLALLAAHYPAYIAYSDLANPAWPVLTLETQAGQMTWHIAVKDLPLFAHVPHAEDNQAAAEAYDGHTTDQKLQRIRDRLATFPVMVTP